MDTLKKLILLLLTVPLWAQTDGPATLPQSVMEVRESLTPSSNYPKYVGPTDSLAAALAASGPGDTIVVDPANITNVANKLVLPGTCPVFTTIKSASAMLPDEFTRVTPAFAQYMPKIVLSVQNSSIQGGNCVRLEGFEITRPTGTGVVYNLFSALGTYVILDRLYVHGTATDETNRGVILDNAHHVSVVNSYFSDFHCLALVGACGDSQAISGGGSTIADGDYLIQNNYLEAAGENIIFGGTPATQTPCDLTIWHNTLNKPMSWNPKDPTYAPVNGRDGLPHPWIVKNLIELKNACRVLVEGNRMTDTWGGFTQVGAGFLMTAKNAGSNGCPTCQVVDVTARYNWMSYVGQAFQIGYSQSDPGFWPQDEGRISIHDNLVDHIQYSTCNSCGSYTIGIGAGYSSTNVPPNTLHDVTINQNTFLNDGWETYASSPVGTNAQGVLNVAAPPKGTPNINFTNNSADPGSNGAYSSGGGANNCFSFTPGSLAQEFAACWPGGSLTGNNWLPSLLPWHGRSPWPTGNGTNPTAGANMTLVNAAISRQHF